MVNLTVYRRLVTVFVISPTVTVSKSAFCYRVCLGVSLHQPAGVRNIRIVKLTTQLSVLSKLRTNGDLCTYPHIYTVTLFTGRTLKLISCPDILVSAAKMKVMYTR